MVQYDKYTEKLLIIGLPKQCNYHNYNVHDISVISSLTLSNNVDFIIDSLVSLEVKGGEFLFSELCLLS